MLNLKGNGVMSMQMIEFIGFFVSLLASVGLFIMGEIDKATYFLIMHLLFKKWDGNK